MQGLLRFYFAACVVQGHMWQFPGVRMFATPLDPIWANASYAVAGFFIISGFVCGMQIEGRFFDGKRIDVWGYYRDRMLRIYPTYLLILLLFVPIYFALLLPDRLQSWSDATAVAFGLINLLPPVLNVGQLIKGGAPPLAPYIVVPVAWSLGNEIWFYAVAPTLFLIFRGRLLLIGIAGLAMAEPLMRLRSPAINYIDPIFNLKYFIVGLLAWFVARRLPRLETDGWLIPTLLTLAVLSVARPLSIHYDYSSPEALGFYALTAIVIVASATLVRASMFDLFVGHVSYPLFLVHVPIMRATKSLEIGDGYSRFAFVWITSLTLSVAVYLLFDRAVNRFRKSERCPESLLKVGKLSQ